MRFGLLKFVHGIQHPQGLFGLRSFVLYVCTYSTYRAYIHTYWKRSVSSARLENDER